MCLRNRLNNVRIHSEMKEKKALSCLCKSGKNFGGQFDKIQKKMYVILGAVISFPGIHTEDELSQVCRYLFT